MPNPYDAAYHESINNPEGFWGKVAEDCRWFKKWDKVLDNSRQPFSRWFVGGEMNTCYNALDYHIDEQKRGDRTALIYDSPVTETIRHITYAELRDQTALFAGALVGSGVEKGDRVIIYMPMIPEAVVAMLACARIGAIHSVVFGGFAAKELATRIDDARPKLIVSASCGIEGQKIIDYKPLLDAAIDIAASKPDKCIIFQRPQKKAPLTAGRDIEWADAVKAASPADCVTVLATDPLYILYTSGTTGQPKGVVRDNGGHMVALKWTMKAIYDIDKDDVWWAASDVGWVVGHSYIVYAPLFKGCTSVLFRRKTGRDPGCRRFLADHFPAQGKGHVYGPHRLPCHQEGGSEGGVDPEI
jgi:propionyl-CoA synthetase